MADPWRAGSGRLVNPLDLELLRDRRNTALAYRGEGLVTPNGVPVVDRARQVVEVILDDLRTCRRVPLVGACLQVPEVFTCYEIHVRRLEGGGWGAAELDGRCARDPLLGGVLGDAARIREVGGALKFLEDRGGLRRLWGEFGDPERAAVEVLVKRNPGHLALAVILAAGGIDAKGYARGVWKVRQGTDEVFGRRGAAEQFEYVEEVRRDGWKVERYLGAHFDELEVLVDGGESDRLEFKATLRKNLHTKKTDEAVLGSSLKTIAGFLNADGGVLAIGVADDASVTQDLVSVDELDNRDKYLRFLFAKMKEAFGEATAAGVTARFEKLRGHWVCVVRCSSSGVPVFAALRRDVEEFFVRSGPATRALSVREAVRYIRQRFPDYEG